MVCGTNHIKHGSKDWWNYISNRPFNGWYMVNEIAVRNFTDSYRYNLLESVAEAFEFDTLKNNSFNKDRTLVELNYAVYHSFKNLGYLLLIISLHQSNLKDSN